MSKNYIHTMLYLSQLKKQYLELCLVSDCDPDSVFINLLISAEQDHSIIQNLDLSSVQPEALRMILPILKVTHSNALIGKCHNYIDQIVITAQIANEVQAELAFFMAQNQVDIQIKKRIPQLDLNLISVSTTQPKISKTPSTVHFNTDRLQQQKQLQSDRQESTQRNIKNSISPNTKVVNLNLKSMDACNPQSKSTRNMDFSKKPSVQACKTYLNNTKSFTNKNVQRIVKQDRQSNESCPDNKKASHSFSKHKNTSSSPINEHQHTLHEVSSLGNLKRHTSIYSSRTNNKSIPVKGMVDSQQLKNEFINKKLLQPNTTKGIFRQQLNNIVNSDRILPQQQDTKEPNSNTTSSTDISIHLKNLISFCNQSILKKEKTLDHSNVNKENRKPVKGHHVKLVDLTEEDENPETARFNSEEDVKRHGQFNSKGLQKLLQSRTSPNSEYASAQSLLNIFQKK